MTKKPTTTADATIDILELQLSRMQVRILGTTPLIFNRMSEKARHGLAVPSGRMTTGEKASNIKHDPLAEYRASPYRNRDESAPALFHMPSGAFKSAIAQAALDIPGATKAQIGRLVSISKAQINIWGTPMIKADIVRSADAKRTPDVRFRAVLPEWACELTISHPTQLISSTSIVNLLAAAGIITGIGDFRVEKGKGSFGQFAVVGADDEDWTRVVETQGRESQLQGLESPGYFDEETEDLVTWTVERLQQKREVAQVPARRRGKGSGSEAMQ